MRVVTGLVLIAIIVTATIAYFAWAATPSSNIWVSPGIYPGAPDYTVWREGSNYFAKDENGHIAHSGTNATDVFVNIITNYAHIFVRAGTYHVHGLPLASDLTIEGEGNRTVFDATDTTPVFNYTSDVSGVTLKNFAINAYGADYGIDTQPKNCLFENLYIYNATYGAIWCRTVSDSSGWLSNRLSGLRIRGGGTNGYYMIRLATTDSIIEKTVISQCSGTGIGLFGSNNIVDACHTWQLTEFGISVDAPYQRIVDCFLEGADRSGIYMGGTQYTKKVVIANNVIWHNDLDDDGTGSGIRIYGDVYRISDVLIEGNWIGDLQDGKSIQNEGIFATGNFSDITITNNHFFNNSHRHVLLNSTGFTCYNISVSDNQFINKTPALSQTLNITGTYTGFKLDNNLGFMSEAYGNNSGTTGFTVTHGLSVAPSYVILTPQSNAGNWYVSNLGATTFTVTFDGGGTVAFYWHAKYEP